MRCPFLREAQVKFCRASAYRKLIVRLAEQPAAERCSSSEYVNCPAAKQHLEEHPSADHCPFLHESLVQYCTAAAVTKYIPYSESVLSQCGTDSHRYCELFLGLAQPEGTAVAEGTGVLTEDDVKVPAHLLYAQNHMWIEEGSDGTCHIGVDAFLTKALGTIDHVTFVTTKGFHRPAVSFSVNGVEMQFIFPLRMNIKRANTYLRTHPEKITSDPYTLGWLFEATPDRSLPRNAGSDGLMNGADALVWMQREKERMTSLAHRVAARPDMKGAVLMADGGTFQTGLVRHLGKDELLSLYNEFFSLQAVWNAHV